MGHNFCPGATVRSEHHLLFFSVVTAFASLAYVPYSPGPLFPDVLAILVPLGVSLGLCVFTVRLQRKRLNEDHVRKITRCGWLGALVSAAISGWMVALHYYQSVPLWGLTDQILIIVSVGLGAGVVVGNAVIRDKSDEVRSVRKRSVRRADPSTDRQRVLAETSWIDRSGSNPILEASTEALAEVEGVDPHEVEPLYEHFDTDVFSQLRAHEGSQWQLLFYTDEYEVRVSGLGTVTVYEATFL